MLPFTKTFKLYLFKNENRVDLSIKVTDTYVQTFSLSTDDMQDLIRNWRIEFKRQIQGSFWLVQHKKYSPRPNPEPANYVRFSVYNGGVGHNFRVTVDDMLSIEKEFSYQLNNKMYWD